MYKVKILAFTIIQFVLLFDSTKQSHVRLTIMAVKTISNVTKSPIVKTFGNTIKNSVGMFRRNKNTIRNIGCGLQEMYLRTRNNFASKSVKYLGEKSIQNFKYMSDYADGGSKQLVRALGKTSIQMRSGEQMGRKELGSLINMVSKSKPWLPLLFVRGNFSKLTQFNLLPSDDDIKLKAHKDKVAKYKKEYYLKNKAKIQEQIKAYKLKNKDKIAETSREYSLKNKDKIANDNKKYYNENKEKRNVQIKEYRLKNKDKIAETSREYKLKNKDKLTEKRREYIENNRELIYHKKKTYRLMAQLKKRFEDTMDIDEEKSLETNEKEKSIETDEKENGSLD